MKTKELFKGKTLFTYEVFPPNAKSSSSSIYKTLDGLKELDPDAISVTCGALGSDNRLKSIEIASLIKNYGIESIIHLPCLYESRGSIDDKLAELQATNIENILVLRGDPKPGQSPKEDFPYAADLIRYIKSKYDFNILAACYPEGHVDSPDPITDIRYLKEKVDAGSDQLISQLFLDNDYFYRFLERADLAGINVPIEAGIMPVTNKKQIENMARICGVQIPDKFRRAMEKYQDNPLALRDAGLAYAIDQIVDLISHGVDGIHLYTMNNPYVARYIYQAVKNLL
ncbi:methylenetetrahydrofolate reductase [Aerococcus urinae]|uniref:Methylenetetrahydrofolate reductase n=1 Tax=Aerococcus urinae TaxID=1376 RepID=A0A7T2VU28_9LACT|nr:methylenetetrahydrofolate reductase [Aerococcus urinae]AMB95217.1 5,10-methylenetetrahydrofolate reductase [Aerococcus urinae]QPS01460.1 methylenetetrahydrofolate reductase [Aerococcus urinae]